MSSEFTNNYDKNEEIAAYYENLPDLPEAMGMAELSQAQRAEIPQISTTGPPSPTKLLSTPAWKEPIPDMGDAPTSFMGAIGHGLTNTIEFTLAIPELAVGTMAGINKGEDPTTAFKNSYQYLTEWMAGSHDEERLITRSIRETFFPQYPKGSLPVEFASGAVEMILGGQATKLASLMGYGATQTVKKGAKLATAAGSVAKEKILGAKLFSEDEEIASLMNKLASPDAAVSRKAGEALVQNPRFYELVGRGYQFDAATDSDIARWSSYVFQQNKNTKADYEAALTLEKAHAERMANGDPLLLQDDLNGHFAPRPLSLRKQWMEFNSPKDVAQWSSDKIKETRQQVHTALSRHIKENDRAPLWFTSKLKQDQIPMLEQRINGKVKIKLDPISALSFNKQIDEIDQNLWALIQKDRDMKFASKNDQLKFFKLLAARQTIISGLTGEYYPITRWLRLLGTEAPMGSQTIRKFKIALAEERMPTITPRRTEILKAEDPFAQPLLERTLTPEQGTQLMENIGDYASGVFTTKNYRDWSSMVHEHKIWNESLDTVVPLLPSLESSRQLSVFLAKAFKPTKFGSVKEAMYRAWAEAKLSNPWMVFVKTPIVNTMMTLRMPIYDFSASVVHFATLNPRAGMTAAGSGVNRIVGAWKGIGEAMRLSAQDLGEPLHAITATKGSATRAMETSRLQKVKLGEITPEAWNGFYDRVSVKGEINPQFFTSLSRQDLREMPFYQRGILEFAMRAKPALDRYAPTGSLESIDRFFKVVNYRSRLQAETFRAAAAKGGTVADIRRTQRALLENPSEEMVANAMGEGIRNTLQQPIEGAWRKPTAIASKVPLSRWFWMFRTSSTNAVREFLETAPVLNYTSTLIKGSRVYRMLQAGGADADIAMGQIAFGFGALAAVMAMDTEGTISGNGGLPIPGSARIRYPKYMLKTDVGSYYYGHLEPIKWTLGYAVTLKELYNQIRDDDEEDMKLWLDAAYGIALLYSDMAFDGYYAMDLMDTIGSIAEYTESGNFKPLLRLMPETAGIFLKKNIGAYRVLSRENESEWAIDPNKRMVHQQVELAIDNIKKELGILEGDEALNDMKYRTDILGFPYRKNELTGYYGIRPDVDLPVVNELHRLRVRVSDVPKSGLGKTYSAFEKQAMRKAIADGAPLGLPPLRIKLFDEMDKDSYKLLSDDDKRELLQSYINYYRTKAESMLFSGALQGVIK